MITYSGGERIMYKEHDQLETVDDNLKIWRYMNLAKFLNLITSKTLWFNRIDKFAALSVARFFSSHHMKKELLLSIQLGPYS